MDFFPKNIRIPPKKKCPASDCNFAKKPTVKLQIVLFREMPIVGFADICTGNLRTTPREGHEVESSSKTGVTLVCNDEKRCRAHK
jgi:hypothetical protein